MSDRTKPSTGTRVNVMLEEAGPEAVPVLRRLMQLYLYDLGTIDGWNISAEGLFGNPEKIERFWTERGRRSFFIRADGALAGFVLIRDEATHGGKGTHEISEFFVLRKFRRQGVGEQAARMAFDLAPGPWELSQLASNAVAQQFWRAVIDRYTGGTFSESDEAHDLDGWPWRGRVHRFEAPGR
jgi:predicted acetyltransferase